MSDIPNIKSDDGTYLAYAWPGGYPIVYVMDDAEVLCADCMNDPSNPIHGGGEADGWRLDGYQIHWEGAPEVCAHCNKEIPSAYGEPDA